MSALFKRIGLVVIVFDLLVGVASGAVLSHHAGSATGRATMSAAQLEQIVGKSAASHPHASCSADPAGGWDYYCMSSDGTRTLYDVSAGSITQRADLPSYR